MAVTTLADVEAMLGRSVTTAELEHVNRVIELVEGDVLGQLPGYDLNPASAETITLTGSYDDERLTLPRYPVTDVTAVSISGLALAAGSWKWTSTGFLTRTYDRLPLTNYHGMAWGYPTATVTVTYSHGQPPAGSPLVMLIAEAVAAHLASSGVNGLQSMTLGDYSESYFPRKAVGFVDRQRLSRYRRQAVGSLRLVSG